MPVLDILDIGIGAHIAGLKTRYLSLPPNATIQEIVIAQKGDRIAFHLSMQTVPEWVRLLQRWVPGSKRLSFQYMGAHYTVPAE